VSTITAILATGTATPQPSTGNTQLDLAVKNLAEKLGIIPGNIEVSKVVAVDWPDASLGCPQKGVLYIQLITPGYNIILEAGGNTYNYHTDKGERVVLCQPQTPQGTIITPEIYITPG
jgi:hypothetical protein